MATINPDGGSAKASDYSFGMSPNPILPSGPMPHLSLPGMAPAGDFPGSGAAFPARKPGKQSPFLRMILVLVGVLACVMVELGFRWYLDRPHFLMEEIVGVRMGRKVTSAIPKEEDYFHYFKIDPQYRGKIRFEYARMSDYDKKKYASDYMTDYCVVSTPRCFTGSDGDSGRVLILQTEILDDDLAKTLIRDFGSKGFSKGTSGIAEEKKDAIELSSLATKMADNGNYEFISSDKKYMLTIERSREAGMFDYHTLGNDIPLVTTFCLYLACNDPQKGVNPFFLNRHPSWPGKAFLGSHLPFAKNVLRGIHAIIHIREGGAGCVHIDGFQKH